MPEKIMSQANEEIKYNGRGGEWYLENVGLGKFWQDLEISEAFYFFWVSKLFTKESRARISY